MLCGRCGLDVNVFTYSYFNIDSICMDCKELEEKHKDYSLAISKEVEEVKKGNYNYEGIGIEGEECKDKYVWIVKSDRAEEVNSIFERSKKESSLVRSMNALVKRCNGRIYVEGDFINSFYEKNKEWSIFRYNPKEV